MSSSTNYFNHHAHQWDDLQKSYYDESIIQTAKIHGMLNDEMVIADMGCGTGFMAMGLAGDVKEVIAIDPSENMLEIVNQKCKDNSIQNISTKQGDMLSIPLLDESVDRVFCNMVLHHIENPLLAIKEAYRVLKKRGILIITDLSKHHVQWFKEEMADIWLGFEQDNLLDWLTDAGFNKMGVEQITSNCCTEKDCQKVSIPILIATGKK